MERLGGSSIEIKIQAEAHNYLLAGGHVAEFELLDLQLKKLQTELEALEKGFDRQRFERVKGIPDTVITAWSLLLTGIK